MVILNNYNSITLPLYHINCLSPPYSRLYTETHPGPYLFHIRHTAMLNTQNVCKWRTGWVSGSMDEKQIKRALIRVLGGSDNDKAHKAIAELRKRGWMTDGTLKGVDLSYADLRGVDLTDANLRSAILRGTNLREAHLQRAYLKHTLMMEADLYIADLSNAQLEGANLTEAHLIEANLDHANLEGAILKSAYLRQTNLEGANLIGVDLTEAHLEGANLHVASLQNALYNEDTVLPDGSHWTPDTDMAVFGVLLS